jgi:hypothetical protein
VRFRNFIATSGSATALELAALAHSSCVGRALFCEERGVGALCSKPLPFNPTSFGLGLRCFCGGDPVHKSLVA